MILNTLSLALSLKGEGAKEFCKRLAIEQINKTKKFGAVCCNIQVIRLKAMSIFRKMPVLFRFTERVFPGVVLIEGNGSIAFLWQVSALAVYNIN